MRAMKKNLFRLLLLIGGLIVGLLVCEVVARFPAFPSDSDLLFNSPETSPVGLYVLDKEARIIPASNFSAQARSLGFSSSLRTNQLGLRGPQQDEVQTEQWLALGDSFTMSVQVSEEESFAGILGSSFNTHVWNGGVDGYSTWQATIRYKQIQKQLPIKHVVLTFFTGNDFQDNDLFLVQKNHPLPGQPGDPIPREKTPSWKLFLLKYSYLYAHYRIYEQRTKVQTHIQQAQNWKQELSLFNAIGQQRLQRLSQKTEQALRELRQITQKDGVSLTVAIAPPAFVVDQKRANDTFKLVGLNPQQARLDAPQQAVIGILKRLRIRACDLTPALQRQAEGTYFVTDGHWTPKGHQIVAQTIQTCIKAQ